MLARARTLLTSAAAGIGMLALDTLRNDRGEFDRRPEPDGDDAERRGVIRYGVDITDAFMRLRTGHGFDEAARFDLEAGAERVHGYLTLSGRDPPP